MASRKPHRVEISSALGHPLFEGVRCLLMNSGLINWVRPSAKGSLGSASPPSLVTRRHQPRYLKRYYPPRFSGQVRTPGKPFTLPFPSIEPVPIPEVRTGFSRRFPFFLNLVYHPSPRNVCRFSFLDCPSAVFCYSVPHCQAKLVYLASVGTFCPFHLVYRHPSRIQSGPKRPGRFRPTLPPEFFGP